MKKLFGTGAVFLSGLLFGWAVLPTLSGWDLMLVRADQADPTVRDTSIVREQAAVAASRQSAKPAGQDETPKGSRPVAASLPSPADHDRSAPATAGPTALEWSAGDGFDDPDQPPTFAPPPHLTEAEFDSLFEVRDRVDERIENFEAMIAAMERDGLPEDHIAFMRQALLSEESSDDGSFEMLFDEPQKPFEEREADIVESYGEAGASPEEIQEMLEVMQEGFEDAESPPEAEWDLHTPPAPLE